MRAPRLWWTMRLILDDSPLMFPKLSLQRSSFFSRSTILKYEAVVHLWGTCDRYS